MKEFTCEDVYHSRLPYIERDLVMIKIKEYEFRNCLEDFTNKYETLVQDCSVLVMWRNDESEVVQKVASHAKKIRNRKEELLAPRLSSMELKSLEVQEITLRLCLQK